MRLKKQSRLAFLMDPFWFFLLAAIAIVATPIVLFGFSNSKAATKALVSSGYTDIVITGWAPLACSKDDGTCTGFTAKGPTGQVVKGAVGCGYIFKGCTVRLD